MQVSQFYIDCSIDCNDYSTQLYWSVEISAGV